MSAILWLRRDLRAFDHPGLDAALELPDVRVIYAADPPRSSFQNDAVTAALFELSNELRERGLELERGTLADIINAKPERVIVTTDYTPAGLRRDKQVSETLGGGIMKSLDCNYAVPPGVLHTGTGGHYKVFTPYYRAWSECGWEAPNLARAGGQAWADWLEFLEYRLPGYAEQRDRPDLDGTSRISHHLSVGALHPRGLLETLSESDAPVADRQAFARELAFREFYADFLYHRPETATENVNPKFARFRWDEATEDFECWKDGTTGYPIIDAGMRQLVATGWMHNRVRMLVASFFTKDLHLPWQLGAEYFREMLVDFDEATNQHSWQWCAGTGTDASPYFRIFNPQTQGKRFDPQANYIKRWVPELAATPAADIHAMRNLPERYPLPIVDHAEARREALARYQELR